MGVYHGNDDVAQCLTYIDGRYGMCIKQRKDRLKPRSEIVVAPEPLNQSIQLLERFVEIFECLVPVTDFNKHPKEKHDDLLPLNGRQSLIRILIDGKHEMVVVEGTTVGIGYAGLEATRVRQQRVKDIDQKIARIVQQLVDKLRLPLCMVDEKFTLPYLDGEWPKIGEGPWHALPYDEKERPILVRMGMPVKAILDQVM